MYLGQIVESAPTRALFARPRHPYTSALLSAIPALDPDAPKTAEKLEGEIPSPADPPPGCKFHTRCRFARDLCRRKVPALREVAPGQRAACHFAEEFDFSRAGAAPARAGA